MIALAVIERRSDDASATPVPTGAVAPGGGWYSALAASRGSAGDAERTTCGLILTDKSFGVSHPVLPVRRQAAVAVRQPDGADRGDRQQAQEPRPPVRAHRAARRRPRDRRHAADRLALRRPPVELGARARRQLQPVVRVSPRTPNRRPDRLEFGVLDPVRGPEFQREPRLIKGACVRRRLCQRPTAHPPGSPGSQLAPGTSAGWGAICLRRCDQAAVAGRSRAGRGADGELDGRKERIGVVRAQGLVEPRETVGDGAVDQRPEQELGEVRAGRRTRAGVDSSGSFPHECVRDDHRRGERRRAPVGREVDDRRRRARRRRGRCPSGLRGSAGRGRDGAGAQRGGRGRASTSAKSSAGSSPQATRSPIAQTSVRGSRNAGRSTEASAAWSRSPTATISRQLRPRARPEPRARAPALDDEAPVHGASRWRDSERRRCGGAEDFCCQRSSSSPRSAGLRTRSPTRQDEPRPPVSGRVARKRRRHCRTAASGGLAATFISGESYATATAHAARHGRAKPIRSGHGIHTDQSRRPVDRVVPRRVLQDPARARHDRDRHQRGPASRQAPKAPSTTSSRPATRRSTSCSRAPARSRSTARPLPSSAGTTSGSTPTRRARPPPDRTASRSSPSAAQAEARVRRPRIPVTGVTGLHHVQVAAPPGSEPAARAFFGGLPRARGDREAAAARRSRGMLVLARRR